jgi:hypothetical protein
MDVVLSGDPHEAVPVGTEILVLSSPVHSVIELVIVIASVAASQSLVVGNVTPDKIFSLALRAPTYLESSPNM